MRCMKYINCTLYTHVSMFSKTAAASRLAYLPAGERSQRLFLFSTFASASMLTLHLADPILAILTTRDPDKLFDF